jgi:class 3 adenylate cyclase
MQPKFYNKNDGLRSGGVTSTSLSMCDSLGRIWFTLIDGFAIYDPLKTKSNKIPPLVHIEDVIVDGISFPTNEKIILQPGTKRVEIKYTGLSFVSSEMVRFKYQLSPFETSWSNLTSLRSLSYTNLKPCKYTFEVFAENSDQLWCDESAKIDIEQKPFFYQMPLFWILFVIIFAGLIVLIILIKYRKYKINQLKLETMIKMKTVDLEIEKDRADSLLLNILPDHIAQNLKEDRNTRIAEKFDSVSVLFADLVGFTKIASSIDPNELVVCLNDLFSRFDDRVVLMGIEKIKTIGDCYMAISGIRDASENHALKMIEFARGLLQDVKEFNKTSKYQFDIRIGINSGEVVAGVIGKIKFIYDVWGDAVNIASRMESLSKPGFIHVSEYTYELTKNLVAYTQVETQNVKGKGEMKTYFVQL